MEVFCGRSESARALREIRDLFGIGVEAESKLGAGLFDGQLELEALMRTGAARVTTRWGKPVESGTQPRLAIEAEAHKESSELKIRTCVWRIADLLTISNSPHTGGQGRSFSSDTFGGIKALSITSHSSFVDPDHDAYGVPAARARCDSHYSDRGWRL